MPGPSDPHSQSRCSSVHISFSHALHKIFMSVMSYHSFICADGDLDCLTAVRTKFHKDGPTPDYVWVLKGLKGHVKKNITFHFKKGDAPDKAFVTVDDDEGQNQKARAIYADYQTCAVLEIPYNGNPQCILWTTDEVEDNVPSKCTEQFRKNCDVEVAAYDKEPCSQV
nr:uncharacterized protein LOC129387413 [Dermacentor andersoni]